jgi:flotillin
MLYDVPKPTEALLITGGMIARKPDNPYRVVIGGGAWSVPVLHRVQRFHIGANTVNIAVRAQSKQNVDVDVEASVVFSVTAEKNSVIEAANRFLGVDTGQIVSTAQDIFSGETRAMIGQLTVEEMISDRTALASQVLSNAEPRMLRFGWQIDSFQINSISDPNGYIQALSAPELARVQRERAVAEAQRDAEIAEEQQKSERRKSDFQRETDTKVAENTKEIAAAKAEANAAGPRAEAEAQEQVIAAQAALARRRAETDREVAEEQARLAESQAALREQELVSEVIKPAEAEAERTRINAEAKAAALRTEAAAVASNNGVILDKQVVDQLPEIFSAMAEGLTGANLTMVGEGQDLTKLLGQFAAVIPNLRETAAGSRGAEVSATDA